ncbi:MAG: hypothetical protein FWE40_08390 [Oscillospiraceae bacterium]|nr:hypothetical protein [Oscillospiraceae bacterium]
MNFKKKFLAAISIILALTLVFAGHVVSGTQASATDFFVLSDLLYDDEFLAEVDRALIAHFGVEHMRNYARANDQLETLRSLFPMNRMGRPHG